MSTNMTLSRSKRILASIKGYRIATPDDAEKLGLACVLESAEQLIGVYTNPPGSTLTAIGVTTERLCLHSAGKPFEHVKYREIKATTAGEEGAESRTITVTRNDGTTCDIEVAGGEGRFRDSMAFLQFLDRVVADLKRTG